MKKLMSLLMAGVMILALAVPAFAANYFDEESSESDALTQTLTFAARTFVPTVKLTLPALTGDPMVLNPYKIDFDASVVDANTLNGVGVGNSADQIKQVISPVYAIKNETDVKLNFAFSVTATTEGEISLSNDPISISETNKKAHIIFAVQKKESATGAIATSSEQTLDAYDTSLCEYVTLKATGEAKSSNEQEKSLAPGNSTANYLLFQFQGDMARKTTKAWADSDKVTAVVTFTFTPESRQDVDNGAMAIGAYALTGGTAAQLQKTIDTTNLTQVTDAHATTPDWAVVSAGAYGAQVATASGTTTLSLSKDAIDAKLAAKKPDGSAYTSSDTLTDTIVLSYKDTHSIPRTVKITLTISFS